jgi:hypothetical protein
MRRIVTICSLLFLTLMMAGLTAPDSTTAKEKWAKGWVSDSKCGVKSARAGPAAGTIHVNKVNQLPEKNATAAPGDMQ